MQCMHVYSNSQRLICAYSTSCRVWCTVTRITTQRYRNHVCHVRFSEVKALYSYRRSLSFAPHILQTHPATLKQARRLHHKVFRLNLSPQVCDVGRNTLVPQKLQSLIFIFPNGKTLKFYTF